jgi:hypothetical protein
MGFEERKPTPAEPQPQHEVGSVDGLSGDEFGRPPTPGELAGTRGAESADDVEAPRPGETDERQHVDGPVSGGTDA